MPVIPSCISSSGLLSAYLRACMSSSYQVLFSPLPRASIWLKWETDVVQNNIYYTQLFNLYIWSILRSWVWNFWLLCVESECREWPLNLANRVCWNTRPNRTYCWDMVTPQPKLIILNKLRLATTKQSRTFFFVSVCYICSINFSLVSSFSYCILFVL